MVQHTKNLCTIWTKILVGFYVDFFSGYTGVFRLLRKNDYFNSRNHQKRYDKEFGVLEMVKSELINVKIQNFAYKGPG